VIVKSLTNENLEQASRITGLE